MTEESGKKAVGAEQNGAADAAAEAAGKRKVTLFVRQMSGDSLLLYGGKPLVMRKQSKGKYVAEVETDEEGKVELRAVRYPELLRPRWGLYALGYWLLGIFGFFTPRYGKSPAIAECRVVLLPNEENKISIDLSRPPDKKRKEWKETKVIRVVLGEAAEEEDNVWLCNSHGALKRRRIYTALSWIARILILAGGAAAVIFCLIL